MKIINLSRFLILALSYKYSYLLLIDKSYIKQSLCQVPIKNYYDHSLPKYTSFRSSKRIHCLKVHEILWYLHWEYLLLLASVGRPEVWSCPSTLIVFKCCGHLSECTIRLRYVHFLTAIDFRNIDSTWGPTSGIRVKVTSSKPKGVVRGEIVDRSKGWSRLSISLVLKCHGRLGECTIRLEYTHFLTVIAFRRVGSAWDPTISINNDPIHMEYLITLESHL